MTHSFFEVSLERIVGGDAGCGVGLRFGGVADVGNAEVDVSAFESLLVGLAVGEINGIKATGRRDNRIAVSVVLLVGSACQEGMSRRGNLRLVKGEGDDFMAAEIPHVADVDGEVVTGLPLNVERLVERVGQLVGPVV